jgi:hypothetical protein
VADLNGLAVLAAQVALVADSSFRIARRLGHGPQPLAFAVAVQVVALAQICLVVLVLGYTGLLSSPAILVLHLGIWAGARFAARSPREGGGPPVVAPWRGAVRPIHLGLAALALAIGIMAATGVASEVLVHDSLSYRLSRIGYWLQEGSIRHFPTNEIRQSFTAINVDLVMLWFTHPFAAGFPLASLAQTWGGVLLLLSTWGGARALGLRPRAALGACLLVLGMPCVLVQFMTTHSDLLTAGLFASAAFLGLASRSGDWTWPAAMALALSVGAKGTVLYALPAAAVAALVATGPGGTAARLKRVAPVLAVSLLVLAAPRYVENLLAWGNPFAPPAAWRLNQGQTPIASVPEKAALNLESYAVQTLDPASNPAPFASALTPLFRAAAQRLPPEDPFCNPIYPRRATLLGLLEEPLRNADTVSTGALAWLLALLGTAVAMTAWWRRGDEGARLVVAGSTCTAGFLACFSALYLWWPTSFRFFSLVAPFLALAGAWALEWFPTPARALAWAVTAALCLSLGGEVYFGTVNAGSRAIPPLKVDWRFYGDLRAERSIVSRLPAGSTLGVALPFDSVLAGFFRSGRGVRVRFLSAEALRHGGDGATVLRESRLDALVLRPPRLPGGGAATLAVGDPGAPSFVLVVPPEVGAALSRAPGDLPATMR